MDNLKFIPPGIAGEVPRYPLPAERIAEHPLPERDASRLLIYKNGGLTDAVFSELPSLIPTYSTLVLNNTLVIEARIFFKKSTGGVIEIFCLEPVGDMVTAMQSKVRVGWRCLIGGASKWKHGTLLEKKLVLNDNDVILKARLTGKKNNHFIIEFSWDGGYSFAEVLQQAGSIPLPPYIKRKTVETDKERYQTIFRKNPGSVAAPTASLHFSEKVFAGLEKRNVRTAYITLNVSAGTFMPVKADSLLQHEMHAETFSVKRETLVSLLQTDVFIAAGTTTLRTLESLYWIAVKTMNDRSVRALDQWDAYTLKDELSYSQSLQTLIDILDETGDAELNCSTKLLIMPGYRFQSAKALITNFHQPGSTLLALVAAFVGEDWKKIYDHALANDYRFLSYGDSSLLWRC